jgi:CheY-like chemotaxis protein
MALKILIADPNSEWLAAASESIRSTSSYEVETVKSGRDAQVEIYNKKFFAVVLSASLTNHSGLQVLKFIRTNYPSLKVLMTLDNPGDEADEDALNEEKLKKMGANEVLVKPFGFEAILKTLEGHQSLGDLLSNLPKREGLGQEEEVSAADAEFSQIKIAEFYSSQAVLYDVFIRLNSGRYIKILHAGDAFSKERLDKYKNEKQIECLYFRKTDLARFVKFNAFVAKKVVSSDKTDAKTKVSSLKNVSEKYLELAFSEGMKPQIVEQGKEICESVFKLVEGQKDLFMLLRSYQDFDPSSYSHAFLVTLFSTSMIKQFEWQSKVTLESAALACLLHDICQRKSWHLDQRI